MSTIKSSRLQQFLLILRPSSTLNMSNSSEAFPLPVTPPSSRRMITGLLLVGFTMRLAFVAWKRTYVQIPGNPYPFAMEVSSIAAHLVRGQGFSSPFGHDTGPTAWVAPLYPLLVSVVFRIFGSYTETSAFLILGLQCLLGAITSVTVYELGKRTVGRRIGIWAAWIWAASPIFFRWAISWVWDFAASALLLALVLIVTIDLADHGRRRDWLKFGILWGIIALTNPALLSVAPCALAFAFIKIHDRKELWVHNALLSAMLSLAILAPWAIRNELVLGHPIFLRSNFWFEFHLGNYHYSNGLGYLGFHPAVNPREFRKYATLGEQGYIADAKRQALRFVHQYPGEFMQLSLRRTWWFWDGSSLLYQIGEWWKPWEFWPFSASAWLGLIFVLTRRPPGWFLYLACLLVYPLPYYFVYPVAKYRHAIEPEMLLLSVYLAFVLWAELRLIGGKFETSAKPKKVAYLLSFLPISKPSRPPG